MGKSRDNREIGAENVARLRAYLEQIDRLPLTPKGEVNRSAVAEACGFDRQVLYKNKEAEQLFKDALARRGLSPNTEEPHPPDDRALALRDRRIKQLEDRLVQLEADNHQLRRENKALREARERDGFVKELFLETGRLAR